VLESRISQRSPWLKNWIGKMTIFRILGKVEPPWYSFDLEFEPQVSYRIEEADIDLKATIAIKKSVITITCETNRWSEEVLAWILQYVHDWAGSIINLFTFSAGMVLHFHLDRCEYPDKTDHPLIGRGPDLAAIATACKVTDDQGRVHVDMRDLMKLVVTNPTLMLALHDLTSAVRHGNNSLTNCGRAVDGMRKALWGKDEVSDAERKQSWEKLRNTLNVSQPYLETITSASTNPRHGSSAYIPAATRQDILRKSWTIMNRFLQYRLSGDLPLAAADYPTL
jgi:hypothetical protein